MEEQVSQELLWVQGTAMAKDGQALAFIGTPREGGTSLFHKLHEDGWSTVSTDGVRLNVKTGTVPFSQQHDQQGAVSCRALIFINHSSQSEPSLRPYSPSAAVGELLSHSVRLVSDFKEMTRLLCDLISWIPVFRLSYRNAGRAAKLVNQGLLSHFVPQSPILQPDATIRSEPLTIHSEPPEMVSTHSIQIDHFLPSDEANQLLAYALNQGGVWEPSTVTGNTPDYRKSVVLKSFEKSEFAELITNRVRTHLPDLLREFKMPSFPVKGIESQLTASNDGDFFKIHRDTDAIGEGKGREITYVYYFHRYPKRFIGGELVLYDGKVENHTYERADSYTVIEPRQNSIVFFLSGCLHEVLPIRCPSLAFQDSRFTVNGWVHRQRMLPPTQLSDTIRDWAKTLR